MRICGKCHQEKNIEEFDPDKRKLLGCGYRCKQCRRIYDRQMSRIKAKTPQKIAQVTRWHHSEHGKLMLRISRAKRVLLHKEKFIAKEIIENLVRRGIIQRQSCVNCGNKNSQGHHPDYSKPLEVIWLCQAHHSEEHRRLKEFTPP